MSNLPVPQGSLASYLVEINRFPLLSQQEERELALRYYEQGEIEAAHKLVTSNLRFVVKVANEYAGYGIRMADLIQEGNIGLMQAVKKFNPHRGFRLISYAVWWIRAYIQNFILKNWSLVKIGTTQAQRKLFYKLNQAKRAIAKHLRGEELGEEQYLSIAKNLNVREEDVVEMDSRMRGRDTSLDEPLGEEGRSTRLDLIPSQENQESQFVTMEDSLQAKTSVSTALMGLNERERFVIQNRFLKDKPMTLQEIGNSYGITRERARQIEASALKKMRLALTPALAS
ncbi:MAG: RNA polymerase sigma factor RpoH [Deltaproteobacteria bacterium]|nr:RNA polymerase sigma factor RpoH [Deltaproteobacteria bacterium]